MDVNIRRALDGHRHPTRVIIVPVAQDEGVCGAQGDAEPVGVVWECCSLSRVEQHSPPSGLDPDGKAMLGQKTLVRFVVDQNGQLAS
jgi:hypothetical protein